jgi:hypothetical protein
VLLISSRADAIVAECTHGERHRSASSRAWLSYGWRTFSTRMPAIC